MNKLILRLEGLVILILSFIFYIRIESNYLLFMVLLLMPDISMIGYAFSSKVGALVYNLFHTYVFSFSILSLGLLFSNKFLLLIGLIFSAHIGMDRMLGYGLKYTTGFKDTHLSKI